MRTPALILAGFSLLLVGSVQAAAPVPVLHGYVADAGGNAVLDINAETGAVLKTIPVGMRPVAIGLTPDDKTAVVVNRGDSTVQSIDTTTDVASAPFKVAADPTTILVIGASNAWIGSCGIPGIQLVDFASRTASTPVAVAACPADIVSGIKMFVSEPSLNAVQYLKGFPPVASYMVPVGSAPMGMANADGITIFVANSNESSVWAINSRQHATGHLFAKVGSHPTSVAVNRFGLHEWFRIATANSGDGTVTVLQPSGALLGTITAGGNPDFIRFLPDFRTAWVLDSAHGTGRLVYTGRLLAGPVRNLGTTPTAIAIARFAV